MSESNAITDEKRAFKDNPLIRGFAVGTVGAIVLVSFTEWLFNSAGNVETRIKKMSANAENYCENTLNSKTIEDFRDAVNKNISITNSHLSSHYQEKSLPSDADIKLCASQRKIQQTDAIIRSDKSNNTMQKISGGVGFTALFAATAFSTSTRNREKQNENQATPDMLKP